MYTNSQVGGATEENEPGEGRRNTDGTASPRSSSVGQDHVLPLWEPCWVLIFSGQFRLAEMLKLRLSYQLDTLPL